MGELDFLGAFFSILCLYFYVKENPLAWPISAVAIPFDIVLYAKKGIYADMSLQIAYFISTLYGWYQWCFGGKDHKGIAISVVPRKTFMMYLAATSIGSIGLYSILRHYIPADIAALDALTTVMSLLAQWLLCRKHIETWLVWMSVDVFYFYLYYVKGLPFHCWMVLIYFLFAFVGYANWRRSLNRALPSEVIKA